MVALLLVSLAFRLGDGSAACVVRGSELACGAQYVPSGLVIRRSGTPSVDSAVTWNARTPVLRPGDSWRRNGISCRVVVRRIVCINSSGSSIFLERGRISVAP